MEARRRTHQHLNVQHSICELVPWQGAPSRAVSAKSRLGGGGLSLGVPVASCSARFRPLISLDLAELGALNALVLWFRLDEEFFAFFNKRISPNVKFWFLTGNVCKFINAFYIIKRVQRNIKILLSSLTTFLSHPIFEICFKIYVADKWIGDNTVLPYLLHLLTSTCNVPIKTVCKVKL